MENFTLTILNFIIADEDKLGLELDLEENNTIKELKPEYNILQQARSSGG
jgi:excinuclease UvrABC nuclease subunit